MSPVFGVVNQTSPKQTIKVKFGGRDKEGIKLQICWIYNSEGFLRVTESLTYREYSLMFRKEKQIKEEKTVLLSLVFQLETEA